MQEPVFLPGVCLLIYLFVSTITQKRYEQIWLKFSGQVELCPRRNRLDFGGDWRQHPDPAFLVLSV